MDDNDIIETKYIELCDKLSEHKLPSWDALPDIELYMDQVVAVMEKFLRVYIDISSDDNHIITPSIINNYVKLKVIPAPVKKRYSRTHIAYLMIICILKQTLSIQSISKIIDRQLKLKNINSLYNDFKKVYECIVPYINLNAFADDTVIDEISGGNDTVDDFILKAAIFSTTGKFICEGILSVIPDTIIDKEEKKKEEKKPKDKDKKEKKPKEKIKDDGKNKEAV